MAAHFVAEITFSASYSLMVMQLILDRIALI